MPKIMPKNNVNLKTAMSASSVRRTFSHGMLFTLISWVILFHPQLGRGFREKLNYGAGKENKIDSPEKYPSWSFVVRLLGIIFSVHCSPREVLGKRLYFLSWRFAIWTLLSVVS